MGHHLTTHPTQPFIATGDMFDRLRPLLPEVPERIERLVEQRTVESLNIKARPIIGRIRNDQPGGTSAFAEGGIGEYRRGDKRERNIIGESVNPTAQQWQGWGTALKPAFEPIVVARKPLAGTVAQNVLEHGTGALNVDGCRVEHASADDLATSQAKNPGRADLFTSGTYGAGRPQQSVNAAGRWPTNVVLDEVTAADLDQQSGDRPGMRSQNFYTTNHKFEAGVNLSGGMTQQIGRVEGYNDSGGASRFFPTFRYEPKAPTAERPRVDGEAHSTVKPLDLMRWLVRLVTPPGGTVLDPFAGSGTTAEACVIEGARGILIEREAAYLPLIVARLSKPIQPDLFGGIA